MAPELLFFLGAGAAVPAGVPDTIDFVRQFRNNCSRDPDLAEALAAVLGVLEDWNREVSSERPDVDVELLLEALTRLDAKDSDLLLRFFHPREFLLKGAPPKQPLIHSLKAFIKTKAIVPVSQVAYLDPLIDFIDEYRPLDVFTTNYDITIEQFCEKFRRIYVDGFEDGWNASAFERDNVDVRLYKLHGSVTWYRTDKGNYLKTPVLIPQTELQLVTGEQAQTLVLYPLQKWEYSEPSLETLVKLKSKLQSARYAFVVGYSFRDDYIRRIFLDAARRNPELLLFLIDPRASSIYENRLHFYEPDVPSSLAGRVILLPYRFQKVLPLLRREYLSPLKTALAAYKAAREAELQGAESTWAACTQLLASCEHFSLLEDVLKKIDWRELPWMTRFEILISRLTGALNRKEPGTERLARELHSYLHEFLVERLHVDVWSTQIELHFNYVATSGGGASYVGGDSLSPLLQKLEAYMTTRHALGADVADEKYTIVIETFRHLSSYLMTMNNGRLEIGRYFELRETNATSELKAARDRVVRPSQQGLSPRQEVLQPLREEIRTLERNILTSIITPLLGNTAA